MFRLRKFIYSSTTRLLVATTTTAVLTAVTSGYVLHNIQLNKNVSLKNDSKIKNLTSQVSTFILSNIFPKPILCESVQEAAHDTNYHVNQHQLEHEDYETNTSSKNLDDDELKPPPEFEDAEYSKSFAVQEVSGLAIALMPGIGPAERERLALQLSFQIDKAVNTMFVVADDRKRPSLSAMVQPSPEGRVIRLASSHRIFENIPLIINGDANFSLSRFYGGSLGAKWTGPDFVSSLTAKASQGGKTMEMMYHQSVLETPVFDLSLGGSLNAQINDFLPLPVPAALAPSVFGILSTRGRGTSLLARWNAEGDILTLTTHRQAGKNLEVGAKFTLNTASLESIVGVGARMQLGHDPFIGGAPLTLTFNATNDMKVAMSLQHFYISAFAPGTQMISSIHGTFDHKSREHSIGAQIQMAY